MDGRYLRMELKVLAFLRVNVNLTITYFERILK